MGRPGRQGSYSYVREGEKNIKPIYPLDVAGIWNLKTT